MQDIPMVSVTHDLNISCLICSQNLGTDVLEDSNNLFCRLTIRIIPDRNDCELRVYPLNKILREAGFASVVRHF